MATMHVELVSIEAPIWSGEATAVYGRTVDGQLGILPGHTPLLGELAPGFPDRIDTEDGQSITVAVHGGFLSVRKDGVSVLAEQAELAALHVLGDQGSDALLRQAAGRGDARHLPQGIGRADMRVEA